MKQLSGEVQNIESELIGKITTKNNFFSNKKDLIYVTNKSYIPKGFLAVITSDDSEISLSESVVGNVKGCSKLNDNDIVTINSKGIINVVYNINSHCNVLFITERCNSNCIMCPQPPAVKEDNLINQNLKYISLVDNKTKSLTITGGEPTLIGEKLFEILIAINKKIPKSSITLLSNGINFGNIEYAKGFHKAVREQDIVIDIPLYSDIDTIHNKIVRINSFYKTIKGIYTLAKLDIKVGIRVVIHKMNYDRLPELSEYIYSNFPFVYQVAFMQMETIGYAKDNLDDLWIDPFDYNSKLETAVLNLHNRDIRVSIYNAQLCVLPNTLRRFAVQSISDWKNIYILECDDCTIKAKCAGFFASSKVIHSRKIKAVEKKS